MEPMMITYYTIPVLLEANRLAFVDSRPRTTYPCHPAVDGCMIYVL